jgi:hypothetical protein
MGPPLTNPFQNLPKPPASGSNWMYGPIYEYNGAWTPALPLGGWSPGVTPTFVFDGGNGPLFATDAAHQSLYSGIYLFSGGVGTLTSDPGGVFLDDQEQGTVSLGGAATLDVAALPTTPYAGIAFFAPNATAISMSSNGAGTVLDGAVIAPQATVNLAGAEEMDVLGLIASGLGCTGTGSGFFGPKPSSVSLSSSKDPSVNGDVVTFAATVAPTRGGGTPTGTLTFTATPSGSATPVTLCSGPLNGGSAVCQTSSLVSSGAPYRVTATYLTDNGAEQNSSKSLTQYVPYITSTTVSGPMAIVSGQQADFTATVSAEGASPVGEVTFTATPRGSGAPVTLCSTIAVSDGTAQCETSALLASVSPYTVTASFAGDPDFFTASSASTSQVVALASTSVTLTSSMNPSVIGKSVTYTASITIVPPGSGTPSGSVMFLDGPNPINCAFGSSTFDGSKATCVVVYNDLSGSPHSITATYSGDGNFSNTISVVMMQVEDAPPIITSPTSGAPYTAHGGTQTITITGTNFQTGATVTLTGPFTIMSVTVVDGQHIAVTLADKGAGAGGTGDITVANPDGGTVTSLNSLVDG